MTVVIGLAILAVIGVIWRVLTFDPELARARLVYKELRSWPEEHRPHAQVMFLEILRRQQCLPKCLDTVDLSDPKEVENILATAIRTHRR